MRRKASQWDIGDCVLMMWAEVLAGVKTVVSHQKSMRLGEAIEFVMTALTPNLQETAIITVDGVTWRFDKISATFEKMRGATS